MDLTFLQQGKWIWYTIHGYVKLVCGNCIEWNEGLQTLNTEYKVLNLNPWISDIPISFEIVFEMREIKSYLYFLHLLKYALYDQLNKVCVHISSLGIYDNLYESALKIMFQFYRYECYLRVTCHEFITHITNVEGKYTMRLS